MSLNSSDNHELTAAVTHPSTPNPQLPTVSIIGLGSFGSFVADILHGHAKVLVHTSNHALVTPADVKRVSISEAAKADYVILAVPLSAIDDTLKSLAQHLRPSTLLIDVCSVKTKPAALYKTILPNHSEILLTHPLFGPESARETTKGHTLIVTGKPTAKGQEVLQFCESALGLVVQHTTPEEHDEAMAEIHALTFFVAKALNGMQLKKPPFTTPSFHMLEELIDYDEHHSDALFDTMESGNPFAESVRKRFMDSASNINESLEKQSCNP